jgi:hypothetical protein
VRARDAAGNRSADATRGWTITDPSSGASGNGASTADPGMAASPRAPVLGDPVAQAFDLPRLVLSIPRQTLGGVMRRGLVAFASARAACPCLLVYTLRLDAGLARSVGLVGRQSAARTAPAVGRAVVAVGVAGRVRSSVALSGRARARLRGVRELRGWLDSMLTDRYGRPTTARQKIRLAR